MKESQQATDMLKEVGEDLMDQIGEPFPPEDFPTVEKMIEEMEETGMPYSGDAMLSVCLVSAQKIAEFLEAIKESEESR